MSTDPRDLAVERFGGASPILSALDVITRFATDPPLVVASLLDALRSEATPGATIAELGFGSGWLLDAIAPAFASSRIVGLDLSPVMARAAQEKHGESVAIMTGDVERLPFRALSLDAIVTCWTLYFMRDIDSAIDGMKRCLRPGGIFVATTVAPDNMREYGEMAAAAARTAGCPEPAADIGTRFDTDSGARYVERHFDRIARIDWIGDMIVPDLPSLLALWDPYGRSDLPEDRGIEALAAFRTLAEAHLRERGAMRITRHSAAFVARA